MRAPPARVRVWNAPGRRVTLPDGRVLADGRTPADGVEVQENVFLHRRLQAGDLVTEAPPKVALPHAAAPHPEAPSSGAPAADGAHA